MRTHYRLSIAGQRDNLSILSRSGRAVAHDDSRWRPPKEKNDRKRDWWISARGPGAGRAGPQYGLERALALGTRSVYRLVSASCSSASTENFPIKGPEGQRRTRAITSPMQITRDKARGVGVRGKTHRSQSTVSRLCRAAPPGDSSVPPQKPTPPAARPPPRGAANRPRARYPQQLRISRETGQGISRLPMQHSMRDQILRVSYPIAPVPLARQ